MKFGTDTDVEEVEVTPVANSTSSSGKEPRRIKEGSPQQEAFWQALLESSGNLCLEARAGTGKSSSCREAMFRLLDQDPAKVIRYCCFNKAIADEFRDEAPHGVSVDTMHGFGFQGLVNVFNRCLLQKDKTYLLLDKVSQGRPELKRYHRTAINRLVGAAKNAGLRPDDDELDAKLFGLLDSQDIETWGKPDLIVGYAIEILDESADLTTMVDFDDMLWLPVIHGIRFPGSDDLFIDECQDLNPVQHELAALMAGSGRTTIVGDPYQAIYGWRGASTDSIDELSQLIDAATMYLTVSWRCPVSHVRLARDLVPDFEHAPAAIEGTLRTGPRDLIATAAPGDLVLCRANAPIISACLNQIASHKPAYVRGRAIGEQLHSIFIKVQHAKTAGESFPRNLQAWKHKEVMRLSEKDGTESLIEQVTDQAAALEAIFSKCQVASEVPGVIAMLFDDTDSGRRVTFSSVHRAKGSEARNVTYLQIPYGEMRDKVKPPQAWELDQRRNLRYVALTRSLDSLTLCV